MALLDEDPMADAAITLQIARKISHRLVRKVFPELPSAERVIAISEKMERSETERIGRGLRPVFVPLRFVVGRALLLKQAQRVKLMGLLVEARTISNLIGAEITYRAKENEERRKQSFVAVTFDYEHLYSHLPPEDRPGTSAECYRAWEEWQEEQRIKRELEAKLQVKRVREASVNKTRRLSA